METTVALYKNGSRFSVDLYGPTMGLIDQIRFNVFYDDLTEDKIVSLIDDVFRHTEPKIMRLNPKPPIIFGTGGEILTEEEHNNLLNIFYNPDGQK